MNGEYNDKIEFVRVSNLFANFEGRRKEKIKFTKKKECNAYFIVKFHQLKFIYTKNKAITRVDLASSMHKIGQTESEERRRQSYNVLEDSGLKRYKVLIDESPIDVIYAENICTKNINILVLFFKKKKNSKKRKSYKRCKRL